MVDRGGFLTDADRQVLANFPATIHSDDLIRCFTMTDADLELVAQSPAVQDLQDAFSARSGRIIPPGSADMLRTKRGNNMTQNKSDLLTKLVPIALVATAALWLVVILITDFPAWTLAVYVALAIPAIRRFSPSDKNAQTN